MADFEVCYFCGRAPDGGLGEYAVVPRAFDPGPDEQHSVVLCSTCRDKLTALMKPVIEAAPSTDSDPATDSGSDAGSGPSTNSGSDADSGPSPDPSSDAGSGDDPPEEGVTVEAADDPPESGTGGGAGGSAAGKPEGPSRSDVPRDPRRAAHQDILGNDSETYNRVLRLLRNREFPVQRAEIEDVAATAYELDPSKVSSAIDTMVQKGLLVDQDGTLRRG